MTSDDEIWILGERFWIDDNGDNFGIQHEKWGLLGIGHTLTDALSDLAEQIKLNRMMPLPAEKKNAEVFAHQMNSDTFNWKNWP